MFQQKNLKRKGNMKQITTLLVVFILLLTNFSFGQTIKTDVYTNYGYGIDDTLKMGLQKGESKFAVKDVFLGVKYGTDNFSANAKLRYNPTINLGLYTASINYKNSVSKDLDLNLSLGQTESFWYNYTTRLFNNYAIDNVISEKFGFVDRTKVGLIAQLVNKNIIGTFEVSNGINNKNKNINLSAVVLPTENLQIAGFYNNMKSTDSLTNNNIYGGSIFYKFATKKSGTFKLYGEYNQLTNSTDSLAKRQAFSLFTEYFFNESPFSILAKYDRGFVGPNNAPVVQYLIVGINYTPNNLYKFGLNWRNAYQFNASANNTSYNEVYFTAGFSF
jgi:hypothetical protein